MIAIIPARGGSKGLIKKNIRSLGNQPLIHWTIKSALASKYITKVILSTDSKEIARTCRSTGIEIPFMRPKKLAQDKSLAIDTYLYTIKKLKKEFEYKNDEFIVLLPTTPFRNSNDIDNAIKIFYEKNASSLISCYEMNKPISWAFSINKFGIIKKKKNTLKNRQDEKSMYLPNGGIFILKYSQIKKVKNYYFKNTYGYIMPKYRSLDIDTEDDFKLAEFYLKIYKKKLNFEK